VSGHVRSAPAAYGRLCPRRVRVREVCHRRIGPFAAEARERYATRRWRDPAGRLGMSRTSMANALRAAGDVVRVSLSRTSCAGSNPRQGTQNKGNR
jgi:hypothetical protein